MANIRTIDYEGFKAASGSYGPTGWMLWSGSVDECTASAGADTVYEGIGFEFVGSNTSYMRFSHIAGQASEIDIRADKFFVGTPTTQFISGSGNNIEISSSNFHLTPAGSVTMQGTITANAGSIGGFLLSSNAMTATNFTIDTSEKRITLGSGTDIAILDADEGIFLGNGDFANAPFSVTKAGALKAVSGQVAAFDISNDTLSTTGYGANAPGVALQAGSTPAIYVRKDQNNYIKQNYNSGTDWGVTGVSGSQSLFQLGSTNQIAGWKFDNSKIISNLGSNSATSPGIIINSNGTIETDPFISGLSANATGWQLRNDGRAEFENAVIRGTLSTAVFEKDTISVVGGQVMVANAAVVDTTNPRYIDYPSIKDDRGVPIDWSGEVKPANNQLAFYNGSGVYRDSDFSVNVSYQSDLWWRFSTPAAGNNQTFTIADIPQTDPNKMYRITFYQDKGTMDTGLQFVLRRSGTRTSGGIFSGGATISHNGGAFTNSNSRYTCTEGLNTIYFNGDDQTEFQQLQFKTQDSNNDGDVVAYIRDLHTTEVSQSLTVDNAGGFAPGEFLVAKSTDQGPDGREGFVREYLQVHSASLGLVETPASGTLDLSSSTLSSGTVFHVTASKNYTFTGVSSATADVPANNDYKFLIGSSKADSINNLKNKIMDEVLDTFTQMTSSAGAINYDSLHMLSTGVGTDGNSYGIRLGSNSVTLQGGVDRTKPTLVVERNMDALVSGNGRGFAIQRIKDGQNLASQGKAGTGYILMNAQPTDDNSPYIDIVERKSSGLGTEQHTSASQHSVFGDVQTEVRIGDLQGITDNTFTDGVSGYGIYTKNGYFKGKIEVTNPGGASMEHNFGGPSGSAIPSTLLVEAGEVTGSQWLQRTTTRHEVKNGGLQVSSSVQNSWHGELRSKQSFNRADDHTFQSDFTIIDKSGNNIQVVGLGDLENSPVGTESLSYRDSAHALYFVNDEVHIVEGNSILNNTFFVGLVDAGRYRIIIKPHPNTKGASYKLYKHPELVAPIATYDSVAHANAKQDSLLDVGFWTFHNVSDKIMYENVQVLAPGAMTTTIEGDKITTGKIQSTNLSTTDGSVFDLDDGTFKLGGTDDAHTKLKWDGTNLSIKGQIQIEAGSTFGGNTIASLATLRISSNTNIFSFDDSSDTTPTPSTATITVNQTNQADNLTSGDITVTNGTITNFSHTQGDAAGTGVATMTLTPSGTYPVTVSVTNDGLTDSIIMTRVDGGSGGASGEDGRVVNLTAGDLAFEYNTAGTTPSPSTTTITATAGNTTGTVYYDFEVDGTSVQNTTTNTYTYTPPTNHTGALNTVTVKLREGTNSSTVLATDQITMVGLKDGASATTVMMSNEAHTLPTATNGTVTYTGSGTDINVWIGATQLAYGTGNLQYQVTTTTSNITVGTASTVSTNTRRFGVHNSMTADTATIDYAIAVKDNNGVVTTYNKIQSLAKSKQGDQGIQGDAADDTINTAAVNAYKYFAPGATLDQPGTARDWNFANAAFTNTDLGNSWTPSIPAGTGNLYICTAIASGTGTTDEVATTDWTTAQLFSAAPVPGEPAYTKQFRYDDYNTVGSVNSASTYTLQNAYSAGSSYGSGTTNVTSDLSTVAAIQFHKTDADGTNNSTYYDTLVVGDSFVYYVSSDRWYQYTISTVDSSPPAGRYNFGLTFVGENVQVAESAIPASSAQDVNFRFQRAVDGANGTQGVSTAVVYGYKRSSSAPGDKPSTTRTWTFSTGQFNDNDLGNSWTATIPTGADDLYVCSAVASAQASTDDVAAADWTSAQLLASNGVTAKTITVTGDAAVFIKDSSGNLDASAEIVLTANGQNLTTTPTGWSTTAGTLTSTSATTSGGSATVTSANFVDGMVVTFTTHGNDGSLTDSFTIRELEAGSNAITTTLSNETHVLPAATNGAVDSGDYGGSGTTISVYEGATKLDYDGSGTTDGHWKVVYTSQTPSSTITGGAISDGGDDAIIADHASMSTSVDSVVILFTITGKTLNGTPFTMTKTQSISKSKTGQQGTQGNPGANNQDFPFLAPAIATMATPVTGGLLLSSDIMGYHGAIAAGDGTNATLSDFSTYMDSSGNFYLGGTSGALTWNNSTAALAVTGNITVTNPGDFADINSALSGSQLYENFQSTLDTTKWTNHGGVTQTLVTTTVEGQSYLGSKFYNDSTTAWTCGLMAETIFLRSQSSTITFDVCVNAAAPQTMFGFVPADTDGTDMTTANNIAHAEHLVYFQARDIRIYESGAQTGSNLLGADVWTDGTDKFYRIKITLKPAGGARYEVYANGDFTTPVSSYDSTTKTTQKLKPVIIPAESVGENSGNNFIIFNQMGANADIQPTRISGNSIATGKIVSSDWVDNGTAGSEINLDTGEIKLGGDTSPPFHWNGVDTLNVTGNITVSNPSDFADPLGNLSGSALYENFQATLDTTKFTTPANGDYTQTLVTQTDDSVPYQGSKFQNANAGGGWTGGFLSDTTFLRSQSTVLDFEVVVNDQTPRTMIGFAPDNTSVTDLTTASNYYHIEEALYFNSNTIFVYNDGANITSQGSAWVTGTDTTLRCRMTLKPGGGARFEVWKDGPAETAAPFFTYTSANTLDTERLKIAVMPYYGSSDPTKSLILGQMGVNRGIGQTTISGNGVTTGKITSTNLSTTVGSEIDLDAGTVKLGGTTSPGFNVDANGLVSATNFSRKTITVTSANVAAYTVTNGNGVNLLFDGSGTGGEVCMHLILEVDPGLIKGFVVPQSAAGIDSQVTVDVAADGIQFDNGTVNGGFTAWAAGKGY